MGWTAGHFAAVLVMWIVMMALMMLPSTYPMIRAFATINRRRRERSAPYVATAVFVFGYLLAWTGFSVVATGAHWGLERAGLVNADMESASAPFSAALFLAAGIYQWTPLKNACLSRCRSTEGFILSEWRDGAAGAVVMGLRHGQYCIGCCAGLMLLLFAVAMMDWRWVLALSLLVAVEKLLPMPAFWRHAIGVTLVATGIVLGFRYLFP